VSSLPAVWSPAEALMSVLARSTVVTATPRRAAAR
jgi:hypothetical protein